MPKHNIVTKSTPVKKVVFQLDLSSGDELLHLMKKTSIKKHNRKSILKKRKNEKFKKKKTNFV